MEKFASKLIEIIDFLCELNSLRCQILFGEAKSIKFFTLLNIIWRS